VEIRPEKFRTEKNETCCRSSQETPAISKNLPGPKGGELGKIQNSGAIEDVVGGDQNELKIQVTKKKKRKVMKQPPLENRPVGKKAITLP